MNVCKEISYNLKKPNVFILERSSVQSNSQGSDPEKCVREEEKKIGTFTLNQTIQDKMLFPGDLRNPYFEFCLKPKESHLETTRNSERAYKGNCYPHKEEEGKQSMPLRIIKNQSYFFEASLPDGIENKDINRCEESNKLTENNQQEILQLLKSPDEKTAPKKRRLEDDSSTLQECVAQILFEKEFCTENPYFEFLFKSNSRVCVPGSKLASERKDARRADIFGNRLTSKDRNKFKVSCPHCTKKVPAPGFVRHLSYCMRVCIRKRRS